MNLVYQIVIVYLYLAYQINAIPLNKVNNVKTSLVQVTVVPLKKRGLYDTSSGYDIELKAFDKTHKLMLRSPKSLFTDDFQYHEIDVDDDGNIINIERTPTKRNIQDIEDNIYVDSDANAVLKVRNIDGDFHLEGLVDTMRISRDTNNEVHSAVIDDMSDVDFHQRDYVDMHRPLATPRGLPTGRISISPEICVVLDFENSKYFNFEIGQIMDYLSVMLNSVNNRFATLEDPKITYKLSGIYIIKTIAGQSFIEKTKNSEKKIQIDKLLKEYKDWVFANLKNFPRHDLIPLIYSDEPSTSLVGLAYINGACWVNSQSKSVFSVSVNHDTGGSWKGAMTLAHELAHGVGAPHDGEDKAKACPWNLGYIMSYVGYGHLNKFTFSPCTAIIMKAFIQSTGGHCLWTRQNPDPPIEILGNIGERMTMIDICRKRTGYPNATLSTYDPNEQCLQLRCRLTFLEEKEGTTKPYAKHLTFGEIPGDNSPCGYDGKCKNGECIGARNNQTNFERKLG